jgi:hypothetical protein
MDSFSQIISQKAGKIGPFVDRHSDGGLIGEGQSRCDSVTFLLSPSSLKD